MNEPEKPPAEELSLGRKIVKILAYPASAAAGLFYGHVSARNSLYDTLKHTDAFSPKRRGTEVVRGGKTFYEGGHFGAVNEIASDIVHCKDRLPKEHARFDKQVTEFFRERGFKNTLDYFNGISHGEKLSALMAFATAGGVTLGVLLTAANNKGLLDKLGKKHSEQDTTTPTR